MAETKNVWAIEILNNNMEDYSYEEKVNYLHDVTTHGCASGCVSGVIYYHETKEIFKENLDEILEELTEYEEMTTHNPLTNFGINSLYNDAVWFMVEHIASQMLSELENEEPEEEEDEEEELELASGEEALVLAEQLKFQAKHIHNAGEHGRWWDRKVELLNAINNELENGVWPEDDVQDFRTAQSIIYNAEAVAGRY